MLKMMSVVGPIFFRDARDAAHASTAGVKRGFLDHLNNCSTLLIWFFQARDTSCNTLNAAMGHVEDGIDTDVAELRAQIVSRRADRPANSQYTKRLQDGSPFTAQRKHCQRRQHSVHDASFSSELAP